MNWGPVGSASRTRAGQSNATTSATLNANDAGMKNHGPLRVERQFVWIYTFALATDTVSLSWPGASASVGVENETIGAGDQIGYTSKIGKH